MPITKAPFYPLAGFWLDKSRVEAVYNVDGHKYHIRQLGRNVFYHLEGADSIEQTCFVCCDGASGRVDWPSRVKQESRAKDVEFNAHKEVSADAVYPQSAFAAQVRARECGRYALYSSRTYRDGDVIMLLRQDGTGTCLHEPQAFLQEAPEPRYCTDFDWDGRAFGIASPADIVTAPWRNIARLCENVLREQVLPRMADPFLSYEETPDEPFVYDRGSEEELERLTRCILHIHPHIFDLSRRRNIAKDVDRSLNDIIITYKAITSQVAGGPEVPLKSPWLRLLEIVFEYNTFRGGEWRLQYDFQQSRRMCYELQPYHRQFYISPPSAHEQAEALLFLYDWLEGKVAESERRRLLRLDAPVGSAKGKE